MVEVEDVVQEICELAVGAAQDEETEPELSELIGRVVDQAKRSTPHDWQGQIEAVRGELRNYLASLSVPQPMPPDKLNDMPNLKQRALCADAIARLGAALGSQSFKR